MTERRTDPRTGIVYVKDGEQGSVIRARALGTPALREVSFGTWMTWERHRFPDEITPDNEEAVKP